VRATVPAQTSSTNAAVTSTASKPVPAKGAETPPSAAAAPAKKVKLSYKDRRELEELPKLIATLEDEQSAITAQLNAPDFYKTNPADARRINARFAEIEEQLLETLDRWERLEARARGD
jgi:ATP-binding cassette subfamily F protein uup